MDEQGAALSEALAAGVADERPLCAVHGAVHLQMSGLRELRPHTSQLKLRRPEWMRRWRLRLADTLKLFPQVSQVKPFSPVCTRRWTDRLLLLEKLLPHCSQVCGRSPVCTLQVNGFRPLWTVSWWMWTLRRVVNPFSQVGHLKGLSFRWTLW
uniref:Uncharacterized protein n=1 Tax=Seriola lalandi dorsalis TaxID=1841481 RepID=A0A3B4XZP0_SERLL